MKAKEQIEKMRRLAAQFNYHLNTALKIKEQIEALKLGEEVPEKLITEAKHIDRDTVQGRLLIAAIAKITTESQIDKTPDEVIKQLNGLHMVSSHTKID